MAGCDTCGFEEGEEDIYDGPHFSWSSCDSCGSGLGGDRHAAHGVINDDIFHFDVCTNCVHFHANGELPPEEYLD